jgi:hypothetical protein
MDGVWVQYFPHQIFFSKQSRHKMSSLWPPLPGLGMGGTVTLLPIQVTCFQVCPSNLLTMFSLIYFIVSGYWLPVYKIHFYELWSIQLFSSGKYSYPSQRGRTGTPVIMEVSYCRANMRLSTGTVPYGTVLIGCTYYLYKYVQFLIYNCTYVVLYIPYQYIHMVHSCCTVK